MKTKFLLLATALFCLASCNNAEFDNSAVDLGGSSYVSPSGDVYTIEIEGCNPATKGNASLQSLGLADLGGKYTTTPKAKLYKNKELVSGATYTWSLINSGGSYIKLDNSLSQQAILTAKAVKSQTELVKVTGTDGVGSASIDVPVDVADDIDIHWDKTSIELKSGESPQKLSLTSNVSNVTVTCPSNCKIGKSSDVSTGDKTYQFSSAGSQDVYVQYTGTSDASLSLQAASGSHSASASVTGKSVAETKTFSWTSSPIGASVFGPYGGSLIQFKIKNNSNSKATARVHLIHRYNHDSATTEGDMSYTLEAGEERVFATIELGGDSYIKFTGDIEGNGGDGGLNPN